MRRKCPFGVILSIFFSIIPVLYPYVNTPILYPYVILLYTVYPTKNLTSEKLGSVQRSGGVQTKASRVHGRDPA